MSKIMEELNNTRLEIRKLHEELVVKVKNSLAPAAKEFFSKYPEVRAISWTQYTPAFNDGEPCYFTLGDTLIHTFETVDEEDSEECEYDYGVTEYDVRWAHREDPTAYPWYTEEFENDLNDLTGIASDEDVAEEIFGNNCRVIITRNGVDVEEYDCGY